MKTDLAIFAATSGHSGVDRVLRNLVPAVARLGLRVDVLGVDPQTLERYGAVHEKTAQQMAEGARRVAGSTYGLATSGIAGPDGGTAEKPVGTVCIGFAGPGRSFGKRLFFPFGKRLMNKKIFAMAALDVLRKELLGISGR